MMPENNPTSVKTRYSAWLYRYRWQLTAVMVGSVLVLAGLGMRRVMRFSNGVESLKEKPGTSASPRVFDARYDIWFDPEDSGLRTYRDIEAQFIPEDTVLIAFREDDHPWGVFSPKALATMDRITRAIEKTPYVRHVRSLTAGPWIRWGRVDGDESGLIVSDLFERRDRAYSERERLERMIAVLGAERAAKLVGEATVRAHLGPGARFADHVGEPRLLRGVISEDGRTAAIQVQLLRQKLDPEQLNQTFGGDTAGKSVAGSMYVNESQWSALAAITRIIDNDPSGYSFHLAGIPVLERNFMTVGMSDMRYVGLMFLVIALVLFVMYRRASGVLLPLTVVMLSVLGMLGAIWVMGDLLNNLTAVAPNMITAIGIADAIHLVAAYYVLRPGYDDKQALITAVIRKNAVPVLLTSITTAVGFFSLVSSEIVPMRMLGYTGGIGAIIAYLLSMTTVPALLSLIPLRTGDTGGDVTPLETAAPERHWSTPLVGFVLRRRVAIAITSIAVVVAAGIGLSRVNITSDFRAMFPDDNRMVVDQNWIEGHLSGTGDLEIVFYGPAFTDTPEQVAARQKRIDQLTIAGLRGRTLSAAEQRELAELRKADAAHQRKRIGVSHEFLTQVSKFEQRILAEAKDPKSPLHIISRINSPLDVLRKVNQVLNHNQSSEYRVPGPEHVAPKARKPVVEVDDITEEVSLIPAQTAASLASQYYVQYENGAKPGENLNRLLTADRRGFRLSVAIIQADSREQLEAFARIREIARTEFPAIGASDVAEPGAIAGMTMTGKLYLFANMIDRFSYSLMWSLTIALLVVTIIIGLFFRSPALALISLIPNVLPLVIPLGVLGLLGVPIDGPAVLVVSVALGVCVDDTIHFFTRFHEARQQGDSVEQAIAGSFRHVGSALTATTVVLVLGFAVLMLSSFRPNALIGQLAIVMIGLAWVADFIVTPALLSLAYQRKQSDVAESLDVPTKLAA